MKKPITKIIVQFIFFELLFLVLVNLGLKYLPHQEIELIYYVQTNLYYLIACFTFLNYLHSKLNRFLILLFCFTSGYLSISTLFAYFAWPHYTTEPDFYLYYKVNNVLVNTLFLLITIYLLLYIKRPYLKWRIHFLYSFILSIMTATFLYYSLFTVDQIYLFSYDELSRANNKIFFLNFTVFLLFWYEYSKQKHNFSEYISNILLVFTVMIGLEIMHIFMIHSEIDILGDFHNTGQYFTAVLNLLMFILWIMRLNYLESPQSKENEHYIKNYNKLYGFLKKPRTGMVEELYHTLNPKIIWSSIILICILGSSLFLFNYFNFFVIRNILLFLIAFVVSIIITMIYWKKRWFQSMDFLLKKKKK